jgi:hypothetical protein
MLGGKELANLELQKQTLLLESGLNRVTLQAEFQSLRSAGAWVAGASRELAPLMAVLAPLAGFLLVRKGRRSASWLRRLLALVKWVPPVYRLWKSISASRAEPEARTPAT